MRKSLIMGTKEDVIKRRANQSMCNRTDSRTSVSIRDKPVMTMEQLQAFIDAGLEASKKSIVTFNNPEAFK